MNNKRARLRVQVPIDTALQIAQGGVAVSARETEEVMPGVRVVQLWNSYRDYYGNKPLGLVVKWGGRYFANVDEYCYIDGDGDLCDPEEVVYRDHYKDTVEFKEVFPEVVERTVYQ